MALARLPSAVLWRRASITLGFALVVLIAMFWGTTASIVAGWSKDPLAHGYIVIPAILYLVWERRHDLESLTPTPTFRALPLFGVCAFLWLLGSLTNARVVQQVSLVVMLSGFVWGVLGSSAARVLLFPLGFFLFALPLGDRYIPVLQDVAAQFAVKLLGFSGVPVLLQGHVISIPGGTWKVAEACSGINYLTASLAIGYLYAGTAYRYWLHRIGFVAGSALVPLLANGLRVYGTILLAYTVGPESIAGTRHYLFGWLVFAAMMGLLFATCGRWREAPSNGAATPKSINGMRATPLWSPVHFAMLGLLVVGVAPVSAKLYRLPIAQVSSHQEPPVVSLPWSVTDTNTLVWKPHTDSASAEFVRTYRSEDRVVQVYVAHYSANQPGVKLTSVSRALAPDPWWITAKERRTVTFGGRSFPVRETHLEGSSSSLVVWNWYLVDGTFTDNEFLARLLLAKARLFRSSKGSAAIAVATEARPGMESGTILQSFLVHLSLPPMRAAVDSTPAPLTAAQNAM